MRPVLLEMTGFAAFREPARVDFTDADYFALVGPTGAGKSTVVDALTFALYGSVPRWDREGMVAPALSPTTNRGVVRLVFDVSGARYSVVRELRRSGGRNPTVGIRNARLERFHEPDATGAAEDGTEVIAADKAVTSAVESLLGLDFRQFCTCVALPQGEFAEFLHAKAGERQKMLIRLLGLDVYERISSRAGELGRQHAAREQLLSEQLADYADATEENVGELARRVRELGDLRSRIDAAVPALRATGQRHDAARVTIATVTEERDLLTGLTVPDGVAELDESRRAAVTAHQRAADAVAVAEKADREARAALRAAPQRHRLEEIRSRRRELAEITADLPRLAERVETATVAERAAVAAESLATIEARQARDAHDELVRKAADLDAMADRLRADRDQVADLREPDGLAGIAEAGARAAALLAEATERQERAERADIAAREEQRSTPDSGTLAAALDAARDLHALSGDLVTATADLEHRRQRLAEARDVLAAAVTARTEARQAAEHADRADRAAALRVHLTVGAPCPVCEQDVRTLPDRTAHPDLAVAQEALARAEHRHERAEQAVRALERDCERAADKQVSVLDRAEQRVRALRAAPLGSTVIDRLSATGTDAERLGAAATAAVKSLTETARRRGELDARAETLAAEVAGARQATADARRAMAEAGEALTAARGELRQARDRLAGLGVPVIDDTDPVVGWRLLTEWASGRATELSAELVTAENAVTAATADIQRAKRTWAEAEEKAQAARAAGRTAVGELQAARTSLAEREARRDALVAQLADAPADEVVERQLDQVSRLEKEAAEADTALESARRQAETAAERERRVQRLVTQARAALDRARDRVVRLGAPAVTGDDLLTDWSTLVDWAGSEAARRDKDLAAATQAAEDLAGEMRAAEERILADLAEHGVPVEPGGQDVADTVPVLVATALTEATAAHTALERRTRAAATMVADIRAEREKALVAKQVADLLRSNNFPRWLVAGALDTLVSTASTALLDLSGGQFELTHSDGEFLVVDHNEADATRSVRTLSGGETFQASLALALALSTQVGALAEAGAARLDSIFLDEGFGTLDESTLDTVAATLENLAGSGSRMVGIITHVAALAERVPVRFQVSRDTAGSHITREGA